MEIFYLHNLHVIYQYFFKMNLLDNLKLKSENNWLSKDEILLLFNNNEYINKLIKNTSIFQPKCIIYNIIYLAGSLFFINKENLKKFKNDGYIYQKTNDGKRIREDHITLKIKNISVLNYYISQSINKPIMNRRIYKLANSQNLEQFYLFHYLENIDLLSIPEPKFNYNIIEYSPNFSFTTGGQKILIIINPILLNYNPIICQIDNLYVLCDVITPQVLKCITPPHIQGNVNLKLIDYFTHKTLTNDVNFLYINNDDTINHYQFKKAKTEDLNPINLKIGEYKKHLNIKKYDFTQTFNDDNIVDNELIIMNTIEEMLNLIKDDNIQMDKFMSLDECGYSLLHYASIYNYSHLIPVLINNGFYVNQLTTNQLTPLHLAVENESVESIQSLLSYGAYDTLDSNNILASQKAYQLGYIKISNEILKKEDNLYISSPIPSDISTSSNTDDYLLETTFPNMTISEKCAYVLSVPKEECNIPQIREDKKKEIINIYQYMNPDEKKEIDNNVRIIQKNVKGWLAKRHYKILEDRIRLLQKAAKKYISEKNEKINTSEISNIKDQVSAVLIIQRAYRKWSKESKE